MENVLLIIGLIALLIIEAFFEAAILSLPGAFTRRLFGDKKKSFKEYYKKNKIINSLIGLVVLIFLIVIFVGLMRLIYS